MTVVKSTEPKKRGPKKKKEIKVGDIVHVSTSGFFREHNPNLQEHMVMKVNTASFYTAPLGQQDTLSQDKWLRFEKRSMSHKGFVDYKHAYLEADHYWQKVRERDKTVEYRTHITQMLPKLDLKTLEKIMKIID